MKLIYWQPVVIFIDRNSSMLDTTPITRTTILFDSEPHGDVRRDSPCDLIG